MTPQRALIEAAEKVVDYVFPLTAKEGERLQALKAAISSAKAAEEEVETVECTVTNVDGTRCGLTKPHKLHEFTIAPPDEYFEDDDNDHMGEQQFDEYSTVIEVREKEGV